MTRSEDCGRLQNDIDNLVVSLERLQNEYNLLSFGRYLPEEKLQALADVMGAISSQIEARRLELIYHRS